MIGLIAALLAVVTTPYAPVSYACDGSTAAFTINFPYLASTDLTVTSTTAGGAVTALVLTTDFTTNVVSTTSTAVLTVLVPATKCPAGSTLKIARNMAITQPTGFRQQTSFNPALHEAALDRCVMQEQQIQAQFAGTQNVNFGGLNTWTATQTFAPGAGSDATVHNATSTGRAIVATTVNGTGIAVTSTGSGVPLVANSTSSGVAGQFTGNLVNAPVQIVGQTPDPTTPANGEVWLNSTQGSIKVRVGGVTQQISGNPMLSAQNNVLQSITSGTFVVIVYGTVIRDSDSAYNSGTGVYTIPVGKGGDWAFHCAAQWNAPITGLGDIALFKTGVEYARHEFVNPAASTSQEASGVVNVVAGDTLACRIFQNTGGAVNIRSGFPTGSFFHLKRLSD